jgi:hypothetical protein
VKQVGCSHGGGDARAVIAAREQPFSLPAPRAPGSYRQKEEYAMATASQQASTSGTQAHRADWIDSTVQSMDEPVKRTTNVSLWNALAMGSIGASLTLFLAGKKDWAVFVGLWPPTFLALKAAAERQERYR